MTIDEAIRILDKKTSAEALREYDEIIRYTVVEKACKIACEAMMIYDRAIKDVVRLSTENSELKEEIERLRTERGGIENVE